MRLYEFLTESVSSVLFHATSLLSAIKIIESDKFLLQADFAKQAERKIDKPMFFLSTARSRLGSYHVDRQGYVNDYQVLFVLNGDAMNQHYKGFAVDYWQFRSEDGQPIGHEMEDRVFSPTREIPSKRYIKCVDILINKESSSDHKQRYLLYFYNLCKREGIELRVFDTRERFLAGRKPVEKVGELFKSRMDIRGTVGVNNNNKRYKSSKISELFQVVVTGKMLALGRLPEKKYLVFLDGPYGYKRPYYRSEVLSKLSADMHNNSKGEIMSEIPKLFRHYKVKNMPELLDALFIKFNELSK